MSILVKALKCATKRLRAFHDFTFELAISTFSASAPTPGPTRPPCTTTAAARVHICHVAKADDVERVSEMAPPISKRFISNFQVRRG